MYAVIETGGKQYRVAPGQTIDVDTLAGEVGAAVEFDRVLALSNDNGLFRRGCRGFGPRACHHYRSWARRQSPGF